MSWLLPVGTVVLLLARIAGIVWRECRLWRGADRYGDSGEA